MVYFSPLVRVIGADGSLTGYGGGLDVKRFLLDLEVGQKTSAEKKETFAGKKP